MINYYIVESNPLQVILHRNGSIIALIDFNSQQDAMEILIKLKAVQKDLDLESN